MTVENKTPSRLSARRVALLATTFVALTAGALTLAPSFAPQAPIALAQNLSQDARAVRGPVGFADIVDTVKPAVISVRVKVEGGPRASSMAEELPFPKGSPMEQFFRRFGGQEGMPGAQRGPRQRTAGQGSGFLISADGYAVTNNHVVEKASVVEVAFDDGKVHEAKVIGTDPRTDLALIKIEGSNFPFVRLADAQPRVGDWVLAVGNPFGLGGTVTAGIVSARGRDIGAGPYDDFLQIDAPVNRGNSGGPTFNAEGTVIGVNTAIYSPSGGNVGIAFAIPAETVKSVVAQLKEKGTVTRGWIGVQIQPVTKEIADGLGLKAAEGALVAEPQANSPATKAGIEAGDVIVSVDGNAIKDARELSRRIGSMSPGETVKLGVLRAGKERNLSLTLGELPNQREARADTRPGRGGERDRGEPRLGLSLAPGGSEPGVVVAEVDPRGPAAEIGLRAGDVILDVAGQQVRNPGDVSRALADARKDGKRSILMRIKSERGTRFVAIPLERA
jgi:serine protease Do